MSHEAPFDDQLMHEVVGGAADALACLYDRHAPWLLLRSSRRCSDSGMFDEVVLDTFLAAWRSAGRYEEGTVSGWTWTVASRRLVDALRARGTRPKHPATAADAVVSTGDVGDTQTGLSAEEHVFAGVKHGEFGTALDRLSPELRAVIQATVVDGMTTRDAAVLLGSPRAP